MARSKVYLNNSYMQETIILSISRNSNDWHRHQHTQSPKSIFFMDITEFNTVKKRSFVLLFML